MSVLTLDLHEPPPPPPFNSSAVTSPRPASSPAPLPPLGPLLLTQLPGTTTPTAAATATDDDEDVLQKPPTRTKQGPTPDQSLPPPSTSSCRARSVSFTLQNETEWGLFIPVLLQCVISSPLCLRYHSSKQTPPKWLVLTLLVVV